MPLWWISAVFEPALLDARPTGASRFSAALRGRGKQPRATLEHYDVVPAWDLDDPQLDTCVARHQPERDPAGPSRQAPPCRGPCRQLLAVEAFSVLSCLTDAPASLLLHP